MKRKRNTDAEFLKAAEKGDTRLLRKLLENGQDPNVENGDGYTALMMAATFSTSSSSVGMIRVLLSQENINANLQNVYGITALMFAVSRFSNNSSFEIVKLLLDHEDTNINLKCYFNRTALMYAVRVFKSPASLEVIQLLLERKDIDVNLQDWKGDSPCIWAARNSIWDVVCVLLKHKELDINLRNDIGYTTLMDAATQSNVKNVKLLLERKDIDVNLENNSGSTAVMLAAESLHYTNSLETVMLLLSRDDVILNKELVMHSHAHYVDIMLFLTKDSIIPRDVRRMIFLRRRFYDLRYDHLGQFAEFLKIPKNSQDLRRLISKVLVSGNVYTKT